MSIIVKRLFYCLLLSGVFFVMLPSPASAIEKALIIDGRMNSSHLGAELTPTLKKQLEQTGLFDVDVLTAPPKGESLEHFSPRFSDYDLVVLNYEDPEPWPDKTKKAFEYFVSGGGGLVIYHSADNGFPKWKEFNRMIGLGGWGGRTEKDGPYVYYKDGKLIRDTSPGRGGSHRKSHPYRIDVQEFDHPVMKGLPKSFMHSSDELYDRLRGPAENMTILATAFSPEDMGGTGHDEPILMAIDYGKGRVFHTVLGHGPDQLRSVAFIVTFQRGAEWAATGSVTQPVPDDFPTDQKPVQR